MKNNERASSDAPLGRKRPTAEQAGGSFPRTARLLKHADFERVYKQGRRHFSTHMTVLYLRAPGGAGWGAEPDEAGTRVGLTVGKVLGGAVQRNRIKRRLREAVRQRRSVLAGKAGGGVDVVINPKKSVLRLEFSVVLEEVGRALETIAKKLAEKQA